MCFIKCFARSNAHNSCKVVARHYLGGFHRPVCSVMPFGLVHWGFWACERVVGGGEGRREEALQCLRYEEIILQKCHTFHLATLKPSHAVSLCVSFLWKSLFISFILVSFLDLLEMDPGDFEMKAHWHEESEQRMPPRERSHWEVSVSAREFS